MTITFNNSSITSHPADQCLRISELPVKIDDYASKALEDTRQFFQKKNPGAKDKIILEGLTGTIEDLSKLINSNQLDDTTRLLLSTSDVYAALIEIALTQDQVQKTDPKALYSAVLRGIRDLAKKYFWARLLTNVLNDWRIQIKTSNRQWQQLDELTLQHGLPVRAGQVEPAVKELLAILYRVGDLPYYLEEYTNRSAIAKTAFQPAIRQAMLDYLVKLGVQIKSEEQFKAGLYDEYFVLAYNEALKQSTVTDDPIDTARIKGGEVSWNFVVDTFDAVDSQGVIPANIRAAGALDYLYYIGEGMRVFDVANALVLRWASGMLDIPEGKTASALYRFHKLRNERNTPAERAMLYKRVLNKGNGKLLSNMVANQAFPMLWEQLMAKSAEYISKTEGSKDGWVSPEPLSQAIRNLQYNLTEHMTGMAHVQVTEDYAHLQEALNILKSEEIVNNFGGRRKSFWSVIEQVAKEDLRSMVPTATLRTLAVEGNKIFQWIANFESHAVRETDYFSPLLSAAESWILAQASIAAGHPGRALPTPDSGKGKSRALPKGRDTRRKPPSDRQDDFDDWDI